MNDFFLVECSSEKFDTQDEAEKMALELASQTQKTQLVYRVTLVGRASIAEATWVPET